MRALLHPTRSRNRSLFAASVAVLALIGSLLTVSPVQALSDTGTGGVFVPASGRVMDTKNNIGGYSTPMTGGIWRTVKIAGSAGIPNDGSVGAVAVTAVILDTSYGQLRGRPNADTATTLMSIYAGGGATSTSNSSIVALSEDGTLQVMTSTDARLVLDVQGYYTSNDDGTAAGGFVSVAGTRIVDTRSGLGLTKAPLVPGDTKTIQITGTAGVPAGASGVVVTMIAVNKEAKIGILTPFATGQTQPKNSFQYQESAETAMSAQVALSSDGKISINNTTSTTDLVVDVQGYFTAAGKSGAMFTPAAGRAYDSRSGSNTAFASNETRSIQLAGVAGIPVMGSGITAVVITLTAVHSASSDGRAVAWADGTARPSTTSMDYVPASTRSNMVTVPLGANGKISLMNIGSSTDYVIDVQGWYAGIDAPTITCPAGYPTDGWATTFPAGGVTCTVTSKAFANDPDATLDVVLDGLEWDSIPLTPSSDTTSSVVLDYAGQHIIEASIYSPGIASSATTRYSLGLGDWSTAPIMPSPEDGTQTENLTPLVGVTSDGDVFSEDTYGVYKIWASPDTTQAPIMVSSSIQGDYQVPAGLLQDSHIYYWQAILQGPSGGRSGSSTVTSPVWSFTARANGPVLAPGSQTILERPSSGNDISAAEVAQDQGVQSADGAPSTSGSGATPDASGDGDDYAIYCGGAGKKNTAVTYPHMSDGLARRGIKGVIFKVEIKCTGYGRSRVNVHVNGLLTFAEASSTKVTKVTWENRASVHNSQQYVNVGGGKKVFYVPKVGLDGGTGRGYWSATATWWFYIAGKQSSIGSQNQYWWQDFR